MNSILAIFTALLLWLSPAESDSRFTKYKISSSSSTASVTSTSYADITNLSVTIKTTGRPVILMAVGDGSGNESFAQCQETTTTTAYCVVAFDRGGSNISEQRVRNLQDPSGIGSQDDVAIDIPVSSFSHFDPVAAGTYTYKLRAKVSSGHTLSFYYAKLVAYEVQ